MYESTGSDQDVTGFQTLSSDEMKAAVDPCVQVWETHSLQKSEGRWVNSMVFDENEDKGKLLRMWRFAVISYLRAALEVKALTADLSPRKLRTRQILTIQSRW